MSKLTHATDSDRASAIGVLHREIRNLRFGQSFERDDIAAAFERDEIAPLVRVINELESARD